MRPLLEGFATRASTSDGRAADRHPTPFPDAAPVTVDLDELLSEPHRDLRDTLLTRRSSLRYADEPVRTDLVVALLRAALRRDFRAHRADDTAGPLEAFVFAVRSAGLPAGVYCVTAEDCSFVAPAEALGDVEELGVQREFAGAGGMVGMYASLDRADSWAGPHGYRMCVVRSAAALYDFHLGCQSYGLTGTLFGGFIAAAVRRLVRSDGVTRHPLLSATYAHPGA